MKKFGIEFIEERPGKYYSEILERDAKKAIKRLYKAKSRFITATAFENAGDFFVFYHFQNRKDVYTLRTKLQDSEAPSIVSIYPAAAWIEKEMTEFYGIKFI